VSAPLAGHDGRHDGWDVLRLADELSRDGEEFALATVVWRQGPSSGQQGSRAVVTAAGELHGWIGGACAEPVVIREAQRVISRREAKLLLLGSPEQFGGSVPDGSGAGGPGADGPAVPDGMVMIPIACQSEGALQVYIEPVIPAPRLTVAGRSPMAHTLVELARALGWRAELHDGPRLAAAELDTRSIVVIATQGHGDEDAVAHAVTARPAFVGLVASRKRGAAVLGYLADRGVPAELLERVRTPVGLDLGHTTHREIAVAVLAELVALRASGALDPRPDPAARSGPAAPVQAGDPVCGMTVRADASSHPVEHDGSTYYFCCVSCRDTFRGDPAAYLTDAHREG
jgi:xanthine dehydrogenase accessory factor